jgi:hypothetical protein
MPTLGSILDKPAHTIAGQHGVMDLGLVSNRARVKR